MTVAVNISYSLYSSGEFLVQLGDCSFVLKTFSEINENYCPDLRRYSFWTYVGLRIVATSVMCATVLWMVYSRERRIRIFTKELTEQNHFPWGETWCWVCSSYLSLEVRFNVTNSLNELLRHIGSWGEALRAETRCLRTAFQKLFDEMPERKMLLSIGVMLIGDYVQSPEVQVGLQMFQEDGTTPNWSRGSNTD